MKSILILLGLFILLLAGCNPTDHVKVAECTDPHHPTRAVEVWAGNESMAKDLHIRCEDVVR